MEKKGAFNFFKENLKYFKLPGSSTVGFKLKNKSKPLFSG